MKEYWTKQNVTNDSLEKRTIITTISSRQQPTCTKDGEIKENRIFLQNAKNNTFDWALPDRGRHQ